MEKQPEHSSSTDSAEILIVDDHCEITELVADALSDEGYRVRVAHDGASALAEIKARMPDLLLLDVAMPRMTGDQLLVYLRREESLDLPIIIMTADRAPERFRSMGADQILRKPFDLGRLLQIVAGFTGHPHRREATLPLRPVELEAGA